MSRVSELREQLQNTCQSAVKDSPNLDGLPEAEPIDLGVEPDLTPGSSRCRGTPSTRTHQQARQRRRGRGQRDMRFR